MIESTIHALVLLIYLSDKMLGKYPFYRFYPTRLLNTGALVLLLIVPRLINAFACTQHKSPNNFKTIIIIIWYKSRINVLPNIKYI